MVLVYIPQVDKICWLGTDKFSGKSSITIRYSPPKNGQKVNNTVDRLVW